MQDTLIDQGINLMLFGMGTVFIFLTILVFATNLMSKIVNRLVPQVEPILTPTPLNTAATEPHSVSPLIVSAIRQAISTHRQR